MQTLTLKAQTDKDGIVRLEIPTNQANQAIEIVLVMQAITPESVDENGYPPDYFENTYGMFADQPLERQQPGYTDLRDDIE